MGNEPADEYVRLEEVPSQPSHAAAHNSRQLPDFLHARAVVHFRSARKRTTRGSIDLGHFGQGRAPSETPSSYPGTLTVTPAHANLDHHAHLHSRTRVVRACARTADRSNTDPPLVVEG